jgi:thiol-disulfide isomerase/thioredoxin
LQRRRRRATLSPLPAPLPRPAQFYGTWCAGCKALLPRLVALAEADPSVRWLTVDYDENKPLGRGLGIKDLPAVLLFKGPQGCVEQLAVTPARLGELT